MPDLIVVEEAAEEIAEAEQYYEAFVVGLGSEFVAAIDRVLDRIIEHPASAPLHPIVGEAWGHVLPTSFASRTPSSTSNTRPFSGQSRSRMIAAAPGTGGIVFPVSRSLHQTKRARQSRVSLRGMWLEGAPRW
jgi:hypothetical protein